MSKLTPGTKWTGDVLLDKQLGTTLTLSTDDKFLDKDIELNLSVQSGAGAVTVASTDADVQSDASGRNISSSIGTKSSTQPVSGYYIKLQTSGTGESTITTAGWLDTGSMGTATATADKYFPIDEATATISGTNTVSPSASVSGSNVTLSNTDNGISVTATGGGSAAASVAATCSQSGYIENNASLDTATIAGASTSTTASAYLSGVTLVAPTTGNRTFSITVPNGATTATFVFNVDSEGNVVITES